MCPAVSSGSRASRPEDDLLRRALFAAYYFEIGLLLVIVPWSSFWDHNRVLELVPWIREASRSAYFRGAVSGLGLVNLVVCLAELAAVWGARVRTAPGLSVVRPIEEPPPHVRP